MKNATLVNGGEVYVVPGTTACQLLELEDGNASVAVADVHSVVFSI